jgi:signal transduction histidine kinase/ligand-binding sensor domain-containing protein
VLALGLALGGNAAGSTRDTVPRLESFGMKEGLNAETINALLIDHMGLLWLGTREGLVSYDGYAFTAYEHDVTDPSSLVDNWVRTIFEDAHSTLWLGTNTGGLARLDRGKGTFDTFRHDAADPSSLSHDSVYSIANAPDGKLWVGTQSGLNLFDPVTGRAERVRVLPSPHPHSGAEYIVSLLSDPDGSLWIATVGDGVLRYDPASRVAAQLPADPKTAASLPSKDAFALGFDTKGNLWIGTRKGVAVRKPDGSILRETPDPGRANTLGENIITLIHPAEEGVWLATFQGVYRASLTEAGVRVVREDDFKSSANRPVTALAVDRGGSLWIGTTGDGLYRIRHLPIPFRTIPLSLGWESGRPVDEVTAILEDRSDRMWVGRFGDGLDRRNHPGEAFARERLSSDPSRFRGVLRIVEGNDGSLWIGTTEGLLKHDPQSGKTEYFLHDPARSSSLGRGYVFGLLADRAGRIWVGTTGGLHRLRQDGSGFDRFPVRPGDPTSPSDNSCTVLYEDRMGRLWDGTRSGGLNLIDPTTGRAQRIPVVPTDPHALAHHYVTSILEDSRGDLWIGTGGGGLARLVSLDPDRGARFERVTARDGLIDDDVMALAEDDDGSLWVSTRQGLTRFDPLHATFVSYGIADGLPSSEGSLSAAARSAHSLYFGTMNGLVEIPRGTPFPIAEPAPLVLTSIRTLEGGAAPARSPWPPQRMEVDFRNVLTVEFSVVDFDPHRRHRYAYRFADKESGWIDLGTRRLLTFTDLAPGDHVLEVRGRGARGGWSDPPVRFSIRVVPPFYRTAWFQALVVLFVAGGALSWHAGRTARLARRNRQLTELRALAESALDDARIKEKEVKDAFEQLQRLTRRLESAKEEERKRIARELHDEMGQLLTATKMSLQILQRRTLDEPTLSRLTDMVNLIDQMIRLVRELSFDLRPPLMDELGLLSAVRGHLDSISHRTDLRITVNADNLPRRIPPEVEIAAFRIVQEAVTNTMRHAAATSVDVALRCAGDQLAIEVHDNGQGFVPGAGAGDGAGGEDRPHLGVAGMRERAQALGGHVSIDSRPGQGTTLRAMLSLSGKA